MKVGLMGVFLLLPEFLKLIKNDKTFLEKEPLEIAASKNQLYAYRHNSFWQCMDTVRDKEILEKNIFKLKIEKKNISHRWYGFYWSKFY